MTDPNRDPILKALELLDHSVPDVRAEDVVARALAQSGRARALRWAAGMALVIGLGGTAWAIPAVREWVRSVVVSEAPTVEQGAAVPVSPQLDAQASEGLSVSPGPSLRIEFSPPSGVVRVRVNGDAEVLVQGPAGAATYAAGAGSISVNVVRPDTFEVVIPASARHVEVWGPRRLLVAEFGAVTVAGEVPTGEWVLPLGP